MLSGSSEAWSIFTHTPLEHVHAFKACRDHLFARSSKRPAAGKQQKWRCEGPLSTSIQFSDMEVFTAANQADQAHSLVTIARTNGQALSGEGVSSSVAWVCLRLIWERMCRALASLQSMLVICQQQYCSGSSSSGGWTMQQGNTGFISCYSFWPVNRKLPRCRTEPCFFLPWARQKAESGHCRSPTILLLLWEILSIFMNSSPHKSELLGATTSWAFETSHAVQCFSNFAIGAIGEIGTLSVF